MGVVPLERSGCCAHLSDVDDSPQGQASDQYAHDPGVPGGLSQIREAEKPWRDEEPRSEHDVDSLSNL